jgi:phospholipase C
VIRFLERRFGVRETNITPWRRAVCGDLTSAFDFATPDGAWNAALPDTADYAATVLAARALPPAERIAASALPVQEKGQRPARPLPYAFDVTGAPAADNTFAFTITNHGAAGGCLSVHAKDDGPRYYTVGAGQSLGDRLPVASEGYSFRVHGPNGFLRVFEDTAPFSAVTASVGYDSATGELIFVLHNAGATPREYTTHPLAYSDEAAREHLLAPGETRQDRWPIAASDHWYAIELRSGTAVRQFAGHIETGRVSRSDPRIGSI